MAVAKVEKINIVAHNDYRESILELLYDRGFVEIIAPDKEEGGEESGRGSGAGGNTEYELAKVKYALEFLTPYFSDRRSWAEKINGARPRFGYDEIVALKDSYDYSGVAGRAEDLSRRLNVLKSLAAKLEDEKKTLAAWSGLSLKTARDLETAGARAVLGAVAKEEFARLAAEMREAGRLADVTEAGADEASVYCLAVYAKEREKEISALLSARGFRPAELPAIDVTPGERIEEIEGELEKTAAEISAINGRAEALARDHLEKQRAVYDYLGWIMEQERIQHKFVFTEKSFSILGWIRASELPRLKKDIGDITSGAEVMTLPVGADEPAPIAMENPKWLRPFEFVTNIYGFPRHTEVDPTPFLAGFFIIFFGLCLTDAGYGLIMLAGTFLAMKFLRLTGGFRKLAQVLFYGSIVTLAAGGLTGGWFGIVLEDLPAWLDWLAGPLIALRRIDPVKDPITMLVISLILGYIHLFFGSAIDLWWKIKQGETRQGLLGPAVWMFFLLAVGFWIVSSLGIAFAGLARIALYAVYASVALIIATQGKSKNPVIKILGGLAELYFGLTGYIADILSYSRLLALGLATGIIGMVINIVAMMARDMIPFVGWVFMLLIIVGGHAMNLVISLVGAFIHSGRLQYVEFFKRFFEGGGREFAPFARESKYVELVKK